MRNTYIVDIDGTILTHLFDLSNILEEAREGKNHALPGVNKVFDKWKDESAFIILLTARPESMRAVTEQQISNANLFFDQLVMGVGNGPRTLINDIKPSGMVTAYAVNVSRNKGFKDVGELNGTQSR